jgi:serine/threonine protein phosphatase PrpC
MKYKVGDIVKVREDLVEGEFYANEDESATNIFGHLMKPYRGKSFKILDIVNGQYELEGCSLFLFTDGMFEGISSNQEVDALITHMLRLVPEQLMNHALDTNDKELFSLLTKNKSVDKSIK